MKVGEVTAQTQAHLYIIISNSRAGLVVSIGETPTVEILYLGILEASPLIL